MTTLADIITDIASAPKLSRRRIIRMLLAYHAEQIKYQLSQPTSKRVDISEPWENKGNYQQLTNPEMK